MRCLPIYLLAIASLTSCSKTSVQEQSVVQESTNSHTLSARFVPEREDDFAWENDLVAFRAYGPALRGQVDAGTDCWLKRVKYPIIDKWYRLFTTQNISYHEDHGEGLDNYHVGASAGCGGTSVWLNGQREPLGTFTHWDNLNVSPERLSFRLHYERKIGSDLYSEQKQVSLIPGVRLFKVVSTFYKNGKLAKTMPVSIGVTTHDGIAKVTFDENEKWLGTWRQLDGSGLGTGIVVSTGEVLKPIEIKHAGIADQAHALFIVETDGNGKLTYYAGYGWEKAQEITSESQWLQYVSSFASNPPF